jgi:hypothetical protein
MIGALNYLNSVGVNSAYMLTLNILGDGKDVWPFTDHNERYRFDCSKLDQWEIVFDHMDSRSRDNWWKQSAIATQFMQQFPLEEMNSNNELVKIKGAFCLEKPGDLYLVYLPAGTRNAGLSLPDGKKYSVRWFNPRLGGELIEGTVSGIQGKGYRLLGIPPDETDKDWVVVVQ